MSASDRHASGSGAGSLRSPAATLVVDQILGFVGSRAVYVVAKLGIADLLADGPKTAEELVAGCDAHGPSLRRVLRTLASLGIFRQLDAERFALNEPAALLRTDATGSLRDLAIYYGEVAYRAWQEALHSVRTGQRSSDLVFGTSVWEFFERSPEAAATFNAAMRQGALARAAALRHYDWTGVQTVVDLGGGDGTLLIELLSHEPRLNGTVVELPHVVATAAARIADAGLRERCSAQAVDLFRDTLPAADVYVLAIVLHDWDDEHAAAILANVRRALHEQAVVLLVEAVLDPDDASTFAKLTDLHMLVELGGRERTESEWRVLLEESGLRLNRILSLQPWCVLEAIPG